MQNEKDPRQLELPLEHSEASLSDLQNQKLKTWQNQFIKPVQQELDFGEEEKTWPTQQKVDPSQWIVQWEDFVVKNKAQRCMLIKGPDVDWDQWGDGGMQADIKLQWHDMSDATALEVEYKGQTYPLMMQSLKPIQTQWVDFLQSIDSSFWKQSQKSIVVSGWKEDRSKAKELTLNLLDLCSQEGVFWCALINSNENVHQVASAIEESMNQGLVLETKVLKKVTMDQTPGVQRSLGLHL